MQYIGIQNYTETTDLPLPEDPICFIRKYPTDFLLLKFSKINAILFQEPDQRRQMELILTEVIFAEMGSDHSSTLKRLLQRTDEDRTFFSAAPISLLIKTCLENFTNGDLEMDVNVHTLATELLNTILIFNQLHYTGSYENKLETFEGIFTLEALQQNYIRQLRQQQAIILLKFVFISKFFSGEPAFQAAYREYCLYFGLVNMWQYGKFFFDIMIQTLKEKNPGKHILESHHLNQRILEPMIFDPKSSNSTLSLNKDVVPRPFYMLEGKYPMILDFSYFHYAIEQGIFYSFYTTTSLNKSARFPDYNSFKGEIGLKFFEQRLVKGLLEQIFKKKNQRIVSTTKFQDFLVKTSSVNVLLIEVKMTDVHFKTIEDRNFPKFMSYLDQNFLSEKKGTGTKNKGVGQLLTQMEYLKAGDPELLSLLDVRSCAKINVYPVIIYADNNLDMAGINEYINQTMDARIQPFREYFQSVKPVLMLNVNILLDYFNLLKHNPELFTEWITGYFKQIKTLKRQYAERNGPDVYIRYNKSFSTYLAEKISDDQTFNNVAEIGRFFDLTLPGLDDADSAIT